MAPNKRNEKIELTNEALRQIQQLRMQRFGMALATYALVILATVIVSRLELGEMTSKHWELYIGLALFGNTVFFFLFYTNNNLRFSDPSLTREQIIYSALWGIVPLYALPEARPIVLMFYLPAFSFGMLRLTLRQYFGMVVIVLIFYALVLFYEYFQGRQGFRIQYELFLYALFGVLLTWFAFFGGLVYNVRRRLRIQNEEIHKSHEKIKIEIEERKRAQIDKDNLIIELRNALAEVKALSGLLPICSTCKKIRDDKGNWIQIESYIKHHSEAEFSHGICPECAKKFYPEFHK